MIKEIELKLLPEQAVNLAIIRRKAIKKSGYPKRRVEDIQQLRRSIDARGSKPIINLRVAVHIDAPPAPEPVLLNNLQQVDEHGPVIIVGSGPAGYFAALELMELGLKPIIFEQGKDVQARRKDLRSIQKFGIVHPHSNYCFGEGGAGTYSDGKLYTRSHKRGDSYKTLRILVEHGANPDILIDAHPHIGSNKLPQIVANIRETIVQHGGQIFFESCVTDLVLAKGNIKGVIINGQEEHLAKAVILATGHSARDIYYLLDRHEIKIEAKAFAFGVRIEHPQALIDRIQYNQSPREKHLPASSYRVACQVDGRGVYSFCMCPGGLVVPAATAPGEIVVNGMSLSKRNSAYANSGIVVEINLEDLAPFQSRGVFPALELQRSVEQSLFQYGDGSQRAPAQRFTDFVNGEISENVPKSSYIPSLYSAPLHELLPKSIYQRLQKAVQIFGRKMPGYYTEEAVVIGTESRTSAPVRIPRNPHTCMHNDIKGLFPCGEGGGYAGGIISAAMDGQNVARAVNASYG